MENQEGENLQEAAVDMKQVAQDGEQEVWRVRRSTFCFSFTLRRASQHISSNVVYHVQDGIWK